MEIAKPMAQPEVNQLCINNIHTLSINSVQQANSGHPGRPMAIAPLVYTITIWNRVIRLDPAEPIWLNRDRSLGWKLVAALLACRLLVKS
jgi:transketolase